jgi:hypothetical protein
MGPDPTTGLDANMQVLQQQEVAYVTTFARTGDPTAPAPRSGRSSPRATCCHSGPAATASMSIAQIEQIHNCGFWDRIAPNPR